LTSEKVPWDKQTEADRKDFPIFLVNRFLSMNTDYIDLINSLQKYTVSQLDSEIVYKLYLSILPKNKSYSTYIKSREETEKNKLSSELHQLLSKEYQWSKQECVSNLKRIPKETIISFLKERGYGSKEITRILK